MLLFPSFILAMFISMLLIPPLIKFAPRIGLVDIPDERKVHVNIIPRVGGIAMVIAAIIPMLLWLPKNTEYLAFLASVLIIFFFGVWDDRSDLNYKIKFFGQILAVVLVVIVGDVQIRHIPFLGLEPVSEWISIPLTIFTLLGITNAMNLVDGLDGLAGGTTLIGFGAIGLLSYISTESGNAGNPYIALISISIMGSTLGFLRFNTHPARIFMGDTGSQFLGFCIGVLAIVITQQNDLPYNSGIPLILLGWPIFDTLMVMVIRISQGKSPFVADKNHIHHRLLALGLDHYEVVFVIYVVQAILATIAFSLRNFSDIYVISVYLAINLAAVFFISWASSNKGRFQISDSPRSTNNPIQNKNRLGRYIELIIRKGILADTAFYLSLLTIPIAFAFTMYVMNSSLDPKESLPISISAVLIAIAMLFIGVINRKDHFKLLERVGIYMVAALIVYITNDLPQVLGEVNQLINTFFVILAIIVVIGFRFSRDNRFEVTTLDFLVIFAVIMLNVTPMIPGSYAILGLRLILFFYMLEYLISSINKMWNVLRISSCLMLTVIAVRGFLI